MPKKSDKKRLILLDSHAIIHRAYHAMPEFSNSKGEPTGALYGISAMLMKIVTDLKPDYIVACYDLPQKTFRHEAYEKYKAGRAKADENLVAQIISSRRIFEAFNIPMYDAPGFEADDIIGTIVEEVEKKKLPADVVIASGDMDTLQLVNDKKIQVFTLKKGINDTIMYDEDAVKARFGFAPKFLPDYKGLRGDPSDNIIGIAGVGEKTATDLITTFGTIENIYKKLKKDKKAFDGILKPRMFELLENGEEEAMFSKTLATIRRDAPIKFDFPQISFREGVDMNKVEELFRELEFRSLIPRVQKLFGGNESKVESLKVESHAKDEVDPSEIKKVGIALWLLNSDLTNIEYDDIAYYGGAKSFAEGKEKILKDIKEKNLSYVYESIELPILPIVDGMEKRGIMLDVKRMEELSKEAHKNLAELEKRIWKHAGREFNINSPKQLGEILFDELKVGEGTGAKLKKTEGGARSTRESELVKLQGMHPIIDDIFAYRELSKLLFTYIDPLPALVGEDKRIHATFTQAGTTTGRFSSQNPNLQNIPIKNELSHKIREAFISAPGHSFVSFDYSQIELRVAAILSEDEFLIKTFTDKKDIHSAVASKVFGVPESEVTNEMRRKAKVINFGILYGMGVTALQQNLGTNRKEAQEFYDNYFMQFPKIEGFMRGSEDFAKKYGYSETLFGRRRNFPLLKSPLPFMRAAAERQASNAPIQGTAADAIKIAIYDADEALAESKLKDKAHLVLQVHDELVYEVENESVEKVSKIIEKAMEDVLAKRKEFLKGKEAVPLEVHPGVGKNWGELK